MTYIDRINSFWDYATTNPLSTGQVSLYLALMHVSNKSYWTEWFQAPNQVLSVLTGLSRSGILKARNELKQRGLIDFRERGTKATIYKLTMLNSKQESKQNGVQDSTIANSTQVSKQNSVQNSMQDSTQNGVQDSVQESKQNGVQESTIANSTQVSKQESTQVIANSVQESTQAISSIYNNIYIKDKRQKTEDKRQPPISPLKHIEEFISAYPKNSNRYMTEVVYADLVLDGLETEDNLVECAKNYADACKILGTQERYIKNAENFLKDFAFEKYLPGIYQNPDKARHGLKNQTAETASRGEPAAEEELVGDDWMKYGPGWSERDV